MGIKLEILTFLIDYLNSQPPGTNQSPSYIKKRVFLIYSFNFMYKMDFSMKCETFGNCDEYKFWTVIILNTVTILK